jgi:hypothetical protein
VAPELSRELLDGIQRLAEMDPHARIRIDEAPMTGVFRRVLEQSTRGATTARGVQGASQ